MNQLGNYAGQQIAGQIGLVGQHDYTDAFRRQNEAHARFVALDHAVKTAGRTGASSISGDAAELVKAAEVYLSFLIGGAE